MKMYSLKLPRECKGNPSCFCPTDSPSRTTTSRNPPPMIPEPWTPSGLPWWLLPQTAMHHLSSPTGCIDVDSGTQRRTCCALPTIYEICSYSGRHRTLGTNPPKNTKSLGSFPLHREPSITLPSERPCNLSSERESSAEADTQPYQLHSHRDVAEHAVSCTYNSRGSLSPPCKRMPIKKGEKPGRHQRTAVR